MDNDATVDKITSIIRNTVNPEKIILFGSRASESFSEDSDYDICIIVKNLKNDREVMRRVNRDIYKSSISKPVDLIAVDSERYARNKDKVGFIYKSIEETGKIIYVS